MINTIVTITITFVVTTLLTCLYNLIKSQKKDNDIQKDALLCLLRSNITSKCVVYIKSGQIPLEEKSNINMMKDVYVKMGGNSYVIDLVKQTNELSIVKVCDK